MIWISITSVIRTFHISDPLPVPTCSDNWLSNVLACIQYSPANHKGISLLPYTGTQKLSTLDYAVGRSFAGLWAPGTMDPWCNNLKQWEGLSVYIGPWVHSLHWLLQLGVKPLGIKTSALRNNLEGRSIRRRHKTNHVTSFWACAH